jgi:hypothetical protein
MRVRLAIFWGSLALGIEPRATAASDPTLEQPALLSTVQQGDAVQYEALRAELARQAAAIAELQRELAQQRKAEPAPNAVHMSGYMQVDWVVHNQASQSEVNPSTGLPLNQDRFLLRRGRLRADVKRDWVSAALELDANTLTGLQLRPIRAEISVHTPDSVKADWPSLALSAGLLKIPFGFEVSESETRRPYLERSTLMRALFPGAYDLGLRLTGRYRLLELVVAVMNGHPIADRIFPSLAPTPAKEFICRLMTHVNLTQRVELEVGVSTDVGSGFHSGTATTKDRLAWHDDNGDGTVSATEVQVIAGSSATPSARFERFAVGADARLALRFAENAALLLRAEVVRASNLDRAVEVADPLGSGYGLREFGWYVGAQQEVTRWGWIAARYDSYDPDQDAHEQRANAVVISDRRYRSLALLAALRWQSLRLIAQYEKNWNPLGRSASGAPTTLQSDAFVVRAQAEF